MWPPAVQIHFAHQNLGTQRAAQAIAGEDPVLKAFAQIWAVVLRAGNNDITIGSSQVPPTAVSENLDPQSIKGIAVGIWIADTAYPSVIPVYTHTTVAEKTGIGIAPCWAYAYKVTKCYKTGVNGTRVERRRRIISRSADIPCIACSCNVA